MPTPILLDPAFRLNTSTPAAQDSPAIAGLSDGRFVAVWEDAAIGFGTLKYAIFNADGSVAKSETVANVDTSGTIARGDFAIAALTGGGFAITWASRSTQWDVFHRVFDSSGTAVTGDVLTNSGATLQNQRHPDIVGDGAGGFYVVWEDTESTPSGPVRPNVQLNHFGANGQPTGSATGLSDAVGGDQFPQIAVNRAGTQYAVVWDDDLGVTHNAPGNEDGIYGIVSGGAAFRVDSGPFNESSGSPDVAYSTGNNLMFVWSKFISASLYAVEGRLNGGVEFQINTSALTGPTNMPSVVGLQSGDFLVVWSDANSGGTGYRVLGQLIGVNGALIGTEFQVTDFSGIDIERIKASELLDGRVLVTWDPIRSPQTDNVDVFARIVDPRQVAANWTGTSASEQFVGTGFDDILNGAGGNDILWGKAGTNQMTGGPGDDTFHVDGATDQISEAVGEGSDTVLSSVSYALAAGQEIESLFAASLAGTAAIVLTGNELGQRIDGNNGANVLNGGGGSDVLNGNGGNDTLIGGPGTDVLRGGLGNDTYVLENGPDTVSDTGGLDTATSTINRSLLTAGLTTVENLTLVNVAAALTGTGNNLANVITGNNFNNTLTGGVGNDNLRGNSGNDTLIGGAGVDTETGGAGNDFFVLNAPLSLANRDVIVDFNHLADTFRLENAVMTTLGAAGALNPAFFFAGTAAHDANDHIIYNHATGALFYDSNGNAAGGSVELAVLSNKPVLAANDFVVI